MTYHLDSNSLLKITVSRAYYADNYNGTKPMAVGRKFVVIDLVITNVENKSSSPITTGDIRLVTPDNSILAPSTWSKGLLNYEIAGQTKNGKIVFDIDARNAAHLLNEFKIAFGKPGSRAIYNLSAQTSQIPSSQSSPLDFKSFFAGLKYEKQQCFRNNFGQDHLNQILSNSAFMPSQEENAIIGQCLLSEALKSTPIPSAPPLPTSIVNPEKRAERDTQRISDLAKISKALEEYFIDNGTFPAGGAYSGEVNNSQAVASYFILKSSLVPKYLPSLPIDPLNINFFQYGYVAGNTASPPSTCGKDPFCYYFILKVQLENPAASELTNDFDGNAFFAANNGPECNDPIYCLGKSAVPMLLDAKRTNDFAKVSRALNAYFAENGTYPPGNVAVGTVYTDSQAAIAFNASLRSLVPKYLPNLPTDSWNVVPYVYGYIPGDSSNPSANCTAAPCTHFILRIPLRDTDASALNADLDGHAFFSENNGADCNDPVYCVGK